MGYSEYFVEDSEDLKCYEIYGSGFGLPFKYVGKLIQSFNEKYGSEFTLFAKTYADNASRGTYKLYVTRSFNCFENSDPNSQKLAKQDYSSFLGFVCGFAAAMKEVK